MKLSNIIFPIFLLVILFLSGCNNIKKEQSEPLNIYLVRHAEKEKGENPSLSPEGEIRAARLGDILKDISLDAIYSSDYNRTKETAQFVAKKQKDKIEIQIYNPRDLENFYQKILNKHTQGENIIIVGHSNTTPALANIFTSTKDYLPFDENDYSNLYLISIYKSNKVELQKMTF